MTYCIFTVKRHGDFAPTYEILNPWVPGREPLSTCTCNRETNRATHVQWHVIVYIHVYGSAMSGILIPIIDQSSYGLTTDCPRRSSNPNKDEALSIPGSSPKHTTPSSQVTCIM